MGTSGREKSVRFLKKKLSLPFSSATQRIAIPQPFHSQPIPIPTGQGEIFIARIKLQLYVVSYPNGQNEPDDVRGMLCCAVFCNGVNDPFLSVNVAAVFYVLVTCCTPEAFCRLI